MLVPEALLRILVRLPKLFTAVVKRCSSATLHLLGYLLSFWNSFTQKQHRKSLPENDADNVFASNLPILDGRRGRQAEACASFRNATVSYGLHPEGEESVWGHRPTQPGASEPKPEHSDVGDRLRSGLQRIRDSKPLIRNLSFMAADLCNMVVSLDRFRYVSNALAATQVDHQTDLDKWESFSNTFRKQIDTSNLLATVLLAANVGFLAIQSVDQEGISYWPQRLSYMSLFTSLASIIMGLTVRVPRFFTAHSRLYFIMMLLALYFPFVCLSNSVYFFIATLLVHLNVHAATVQLYGAIAVISLLVHNLIWYALLTEPEGIDTVANQIATSLNRF